MAEAFKHLINADLVTATGHHLWRAWRGFDRAAFEHLALAGLDALEMKARAMQIASALEATLPADFDRAAGIIEAALGPSDEGDGERVGRLPITDQGLAGWVVWPLGEFVARRGMDDPLRALACLRELTQRFSAEFSIRPFIARHPTLAWETLAHWVHDPNAHVRRLVSEGSRPRLPWGLQLRALIEDPSPTLPLLRILQDDPAAYVRRSVANHLNDIAKDHPAVVVDWVRAHLPDASAERRALLSHASRTLIKDGHAPMLALWGVGAPFDGSIQLELAPRQVPIGASVAMTVSLRSRSRVAQALVIDIVMRGPGAAGKPTTKVFKGWALELAPGVARELARNHSMRVVTTRRLVPGRHELALRVNGVDAVSARFELVDAP
jgi:3-methyladenine DNA glycosylase AlkC